MVTLAYGLPMATTQRPQQRVAVHQNYAIGADQ